MTGFLPQLESLFSAALRKHELNEGRARYQFDYTHVSPLAILKELPIEDEFSFKWLELVGKRALEGLANRKDLDEDSLNTGNQAQKHRSLLALFERGETAIAEIKLRVTEALRFEGRIRASRSPAKSLEDYADMFRAIGLPPIAKNFRDDSVFSSMRVAGPNPVMLQRLKAIDERLPITNALFQVAAPHDSLDAAIAEGRLYLADYAVLDGAELGTLPNGQKYLYAPLALFVITGPRKELLPVAIQCQQKPAADNPIFTPKDGFNWLIAKTIVETADGNIHEGSTHLARTHLIMEAFVISTHRQLASAHPLSLLLLPHFQGTLAINNLAWKHLISNGGAVDLLLGGTIDTSRSVAAHGLQSLNVMNNLLPMTFAQRDVADRDAFPDYPYRDDSLLYWDVIHEWVTSYLQIYYPDDAHVVEDFELQAWSREVSAADGGRINGLPNNGVIQRVQELIELVTFIIYTCSVQHAAVNFPQLDCMSYVPNMPLAGYRPAPTSTTGATEADFVAMLPTLDMAELQMEVCTLLGGVHYTQLGQYGFAHFHDQRVSAPLGIFQKRLADTGRTIAERNLTRRPYETLAPSGIPQSINI
ncbi:MAG: lipoxygenase [Fuerstia sp.]|nr:lipoxygenase [Fuerstiella sp.]